jgi:lipid-A-disaccharide synthase-like uncharacterized protein
LSRSSFRFCLVAALTLAAASAAQGRQEEAMQGPESVPEEAVRAEAYVKAQLAGVSDRVGIVRGEGGDLLFRLEGDGEVTLLSPEAFAARVYGEQRGQPWWYLLFNITSPLGVAWVGLGFLGQLLFTGRMLVQWLASERSRRSVVPPAFWWMSLIGASMLLVYFVWRRDIVGVIGQATGWAIYLRNLWLIYRAGEAAPAAGDPAPQAEL